MPLILSAISRVQAQNDPVERTFAEPRTDVEKAVESAKTTFHGKLPVLEGFVAQTRHPVERYERAYYQCLFQVIPSMSGETSVRVTAKVTAWYDDPDKQRSGYEVLPSNGRLENDALDRVQETLDGDGTGSPKTDTPPVTKYNLSLGPAIPHRTTVGSGVGKDSRPPAATVIPGSVSEEEIQELRKKRVATEKRVQQLNNALQNLQTLYDSQTKPNDLVAIKKTGTPVYARPEAGEKPLFAAAAKDQFKMVEIRGEWVHIQISGESRGWIRKVQLEFPEDSPMAAGATSAGSLNSRELFRITHQETGTFPGNWEPLRGKQVRVYSVQPAQSPATETAPRDKLDFVKELFLRTWKEHEAADTTIAGVVVVFDSADGGQASATLTSVEQWQQGKLSDADFWEACSLDPPETFALTAKKR